MLRMEEGKGAILAVGLNPAWQKTLVFPRLRFYQVNRSETVTAMASGKGINFVRALNILGHDAKVYQFTGGATGKMIREYLDKEAIKHCSIPVDSPTRVCTTCLCEKSGKMTELIEPSGFIPPAAAEKFMKEISASIPSSKGLALCGTFPPGISDSFYAELAGKARKAGVPVLLDAWKDVNPTLENGVDVLKINSDEIKDMTRKKSLEDAIKACLKKYDVKIVAITAGAHNSVLVENGNMWVFKIPKLKKILNPIGAGDTVSAVFFAEYLAGKLPHEAFRMGLAAASASCLHQEAAVFDIETALKIRENIKVTMKHF